MTWNEVIMYVIETFFKLVIAVAVPYAFNLIRVKMKNDTQIRYLKRTENLIREAVEQVQQTYVDNMKAEDMFDKDAQVKAFKMVRDAVLSMMNAEMKQVVMETVGDFETYLTNKIESEVYNNKLGLVSLAEAE